MLDKTKGARILIDIKHLSIKARQQFYTFIDTEFSNETIPIIFSHGGVNGLPTIKTPNQSLPNTLFNHWDINLFDDEIIRIAKSHGIIGLNLDQRIMASNQEIKKSKNNFTKHSMLFNSSKLIWNNIQHIAITLDNEGINAWDNICIGSDFDGIIDPINGFWSEEYLSELRNYLLIHSTNFYKQAVLKPFNMITPDEIIDKIMIKNLIDFYQNNFTGKASQSI